MDNHAIECQESIEKRYSRKFIDGYIRKEIEANPDTVKQVEQGVIFLQYYMNQDYYASKNARIAQLQGMDLRSLVMDILVGIAYCQTAELFTSVTAQLAGRLKFSDKTEAITTVAELVAVLCQTDAFDIEKPNRMVSLSVISRIPLSKKLIRYIENSRYLPPMVCEPLELTNNYSSGYLTHNNSLILGSGNHHDGDICLDVLNLVNKVQLQLDTDFISTVEEEPTFDVENPEQLEQWMQFKRQSYEFYLLITEHGNRFYLTHKVDKRGRLYAQGYQITTQGTAHKKAIIELAKEELVEGVPL